MDRFYLELAELRGRELRRQAEHRNLVSALASTQPNVLTTVLEKIAAFLGRRRRVEEPQLLGG